MACNEKANQKIFQENSDKRHWTQMETEFAQKFPSLADSTQTIFDRSVPSQSRADSPQAAPDNGQPSSSSSSPPSSNSPSTTIIDTSRKV